MWLLSCEGDVLGGKRSWLRPGSTHLLGRTSGRGDGEQIRFIDQKSVSRKHLLIKVDEVNDRDAGNLHSRPRLTVTDGSKIGTHVNGDKIKQEEKELTGNEYIIRLGSYEAAFKIEWKPIVISNNAKKAPDRQLLAGTGIKVVSEFIASSTTHTVGKKRNSPVVLSALVCGRWVVSDSFVKALAAATKKVMIEDVAVSPLEQDFDAHWPSEKDHPVPAATEPVPREDSYLKPNAERAEIFQDFVIVFLSQSQYDSLLPVITSGGGKAMLFELLEDTAMNDLISFVATAAGQKKSRGPFRLTQQTGGGGVVLVQHSSVDDWVQDFNSNLENTLGQESIMQNEFLDAILTLDTSTLQRPVANSQGGKAQPTTTGYTQPPSAQPQAMDIEGSPPSPPPSSKAAPATQSTSTQPTKEEPESSAPKYTRRKKFATQSRFKGFDDIEPLDFVGPSTTDNAADPSQAMDVDEPSQAEGGTQTRAGQKRKSDVLETKDEEEEEMLPGQAEFIKRQRLEAEAGRGKKATTSSSREGTLTDDVKSKTRKGKQKELDVKAELQKQRREEEEQRRKDEEELHTYDDDVDISDLKDLAIVEEMELPARDRTSSNFTQHTQGDRWKPEWDGRKNFKRFRRRGQEPTQEGRPRARLIVTVEEVGGSSHGIDIASLQAASQKSQRSKPRKSQSQTQQRSQTQTQTQTLAGDDEEGEDDDQTRFRRRIQRSLEDDADEADLHEEFADDFDDSAAASGPSTTKPAARKKRAAPSAPASEGPPAKKARATTSRAAAPAVFTIDDDDDSDDDHLKFRRKKR